jgi:tRNA (Thr-GGU) A37 N-methylase
VNRPCGPDKCKIHRQVRKEIAKIGRTPYRPNPIGGTVVKLLDKSVNVVRVRGTRCYRWLSNN